MESHPPSTMRPQPEQLWGRHPKPTELGVFSRALMAGRSAGRVSDPQMRSRRLSGPSCAPIAGRIAAFEPPSTPPHRPRRLVTEVLTGEVRLVVGIACFRATGSPSNQGVCR